MIGVSYARQPVLKNVLLLADASGFSEKGIPFAIAIARRYESKVHVLQVVIPISCTPTALPDNCASANHAVQGDGGQEMRRPDARLNGLVHEILTINDKSVWSGTQQILESRPIDLLILSPNSQAQAAETLRTSTTDEVMRKAGIPVLAIGPGVSSRREVSLFHRVLFATDLSPELKSALRRAVSMMQDMESELFFLHVMPDPVSGEHAERDSAANVMHQLYDLLPYSFNLVDRPRTVIRYGNSAQQILEAAREHDVDLIVLGVRETLDLESASHNQNTVRNIVRGSCCPILTVPVEEDRDQPKPRSVN